MIYFIVYLIFPYWNLISLNFPPEGMVVSIRCRIILLIIKLKKQLFHRELLFNFHPIVSFVFLNPWNTRLERFFLFPPKAFSYYSASLLFCSIVSSSLQFHRLLLTSYVWFSHLLHCLHNRALRYNLQYKQLSYHVLL